MKKVLKAIYNLIPFKRELFIFLKTVWKPKESVYQHLHFKGEFDVVVEGNKKFKLYHPGHAIENSIFWNGLLNDWEKDSLNLWIKLCKTSSTIVDIGANTGIYSLIAKAVAPASKVYAFEPHPYFFSLLKKNNELNQFDIACINKAASDRDGAVVLEDYTGAESTLTFQSATLDNFVKQNGITKIDLMKIDVEQHEPQVLAGFSTYLSQFQPTMIIEVLSEDIATRIGKMVDGLDYLYFNLNEKGQIRQTSKIEKSDYYNYLFCNRNVAETLGLLKRK